MMELAVYALLVVFIFSRLYSSLGKSSEINIQNIKVNKIDLLKDDNEEVEDIDKDEDFFNTLESSKASKIRAVVNNIKSKDKRFGVTDFLNKSGYAFELIVTAFNKGDKETLKALVDDKIYNTLIKELEKREQSGLVVHDVIVSVKQPEIIEIKLIKNIAYIVVKFVSEQINFVKNQAGEIISGNISKINKIEDIWQFKRDITSSSQTWLVISTNYKL